MVVAMWSAATDSSGMYVQLLCMYACICDAYICWPLSHGHFKTFHSLAGLDFLLGGKVKAVGKSHAHTYTAHTHRQTDRRTDNAIGSILA